MGDYLEPDFNTKVLARRHAKVPVLCVHIKGMSGLLVELDIISQKCRRIGIYRVPKAMGPMLYVKPITWIIKRRKGGHYDGQCQ